VTGRNIVVMSFPPALWLVEHSHDITGSQWPTDIVIVRQRSAIQFHDNIAVQLQRIQQAHQCGAGIYRSPLQRRARQPL
jgi:hypothetical protein